MAHMYSRVHCILQCIVHAKFCHNVPLLLPQLLSQEGILQMAGPFQVPPTPALSLCVPKEEALLVPADVVCYHTQAHLCHGKYDV